MKYITLTQSKVAIVDDEDFEWLSQWKWYVSKGYAVRSSRLGEAPKRTTISMHSQIIKRPKKAEIDHISGNKLDNRRTNLRLVTRTQNSMNRDKLSNNTSGHRGVYWNSMWRRWEAFIRENGTKHYLGRYRNIEKAIEARNKAEDRYFGEYARK